MSYDIYIGNAICEKDDGGNYRVVVERVTHPDAPDMGPDDMSGKTNGRHPGYGQMGEWAARVKLSPLWNELLRQHPGIVDLHPRHLRRLDGAIAFYRAAHPQARPPWESGEGAESDLDLGHLLWYRFWFAWALKRCANPAVENY